MRPILLSAIQIAAMVAILISPTALSSAPSTTAAETSSSLDRQMLSRQAREFAASINPSSGSSIYTSYYRGYPLVRAVFVQGDIETRALLIADASELIANLPTFHMLQAKIGQRDQPLNASLDGLPFPSDPKFAGFRIFPLEEGGRLVVNTGNIHQFGHYLSTLLRLGASDKELRSRSEVQRDLLAIARYLERDFLQLFWIELPAWHWSGAFEGGMRQRSLARLGIGREINRRRFFRGFLDYDLHLFAVAADLRAAINSSAVLDDTRRRRDLVEDIWSIAWEVLDLRVDAGPAGSEFSFDRGYWDDNPIAKFAGCQTARPPSDPCPISDYTIDISHAQRWPAWLESFEAGASSQYQAEKIRRWRSSLATTIAENLYYQDGRTLLPNFLDGRDGWFVTVENSNGEGAHPPSSLTGWAMRFGALARLARYDRRIEHAQARFCETIESTLPADQEFRTRYYGHPQAHPANGIRPPRDEYGPDTLYVQICRMEEIASRRQGVPRMEERPQDQRYQ